jgi:hypothetical protein
VDPDGAFTNIALPCLMNIATTTKRSKITFFYPIPVVWLDFGEFSKGLQLGVSDSHLVVSPLFIPSESSGHFWINFHDSRYRLGALCRCSLSPGL